MTLVLPASSLFGQAVDMVAIVATANAQPLPLNGTMTFTVDGVAQPPMLGGIANLPQFLLTLNLSAGVHTISADYDGDSNVFAEGTTGTITVNRADTAATISIITPGEGAIFGGPVAFSVTINRTTLGTGTPTGLVILKEGNTTLASAPLESGQVSFTIPDFSAGTHTVIATYEGDDSFFGSTTFPRTVVVRKAATATSVSSSPGVTTFGRDVTFTATVSALPGLPLPPTGAVHFWDGGVELGSGTVDATGHATLVTAGLHGGSRDLIAIYDGDANYLESSGVVFQQVDPAVTSTQVIASSAVSAFGQPVTFTVTVGPAEAGVPAPTGWSVNLQITDSVGRLVSSPLLTLVAGTASFTAADLPVGDLTVKAEFFRNDDYEGSHSDALTHTVVSRPSSTQLTSSTNPVVYGQGMTFFVTVTGDGPTPTGTVEFRDGANTFGAALLSGGKATFTPSVLFGAGQHSITAVYRGDAAYATSISPAVMQTVDKALITVKADDKSRLYATADRFTATFSGFKNGETLTTSGVTGGPALSTTATISSSVGNYPITASLGTLAASNYTFAFVPGKLTVTLAPLSATAVNFGATAGAPFSGTVATFTNADPFGSAASYTATITWGDGSTSAGVISGNGNSLNVTGSHTYADPINEAVDVQVSHNLGNTTTATVSDQATVTSLGQSVKKGLTGNISFWNGVSGQKLINSFNGASSAKALSTWLAGTFPNLYGGGASGNNLNGKSNAQVAAYFKALVALGGDQAQAQVLAVALNVYATTTSLGGSVGTAFGFTVSGVGLGAFSYDVGKDGAAFGVANNATRNVYQLLLAVNRKAVKGALYSGDTTLQAQVADLFDALNKAGTI